MTFRERELKMGQSFVVDWNNYIRAVCVWRLECNENKEIGSGPGLLVRIYESIFVRRKKNAGRISKQRWVFEYVEKPKSISQLLVCLLNGRRKLVANFTKISAKPGSIVLSNCQRACRNRTQTKFKHNTAKPLKVNLKKKALVILLNRMDTEAHT